ncbi:MAG: class I SAM-dependent methyltransferase [Solirubrobacteraceae bacterium]|nr:class I SAM-dependent methyltransferase [Patulibacter sp.]
MSGPWPSLAPLAAPGRWTTDQALDVLRDAVRDPRRTRTLQHHEVVTWVRRDLVAPATAAPDPDAVYRRVRDGGGGETAFLSGEPALQRAGYGTLCDGVPVTARQRFLGLGNVWCVGLPDARDRVLDLGCGAGVDTMIAARALGSGEARGVDVRTTLLPDTGDTFPRCVFSAAPAEATALPDGWATLVIANGLPPLLGLERAGPVLDEIRRVSTPDVELRFTTLLADPGIGDLGLVNARRTGKPLASDVIALLAEAGWAVGEIVPLPSLFVEPAVRSGERFALVRASRAAT